MIFRLPNPPINYKCPYIYLHVKLQSKKLLSYIQFDIKPLTNQGSSLKIIHQIKKMNKNHGFFLLNTNLTCSSDCKRNQKNSKHISQPIFVEYKNKTYNIIKKRLELINVIQIVMKKQDLKREIADVSNDVYYQKLGEVRKKLRTWISAKDDLIKEHYVQISDHLFQQIAQQQKNIDKYCDFFHHLFEDICESISRASTENSPKKSLFGSKSKQVSQSSQQISKNAEKYRQVWLSRKQCLKKINILGGITIQKLGKQSQEGGKSLSQLKSICKKIRSFNEQAASSNQYSKKCEINVVRKNQKQLEVNKIKQISDIFKKQIQHNEMLFAKFIEGFNKYIVLENSNLDSLTSNLVSLTYLINQSFVGFQNLQITEVTQLQANFQKSSERLRLFYTNSQKIRKQMIVGLIQRLEEINAETLGNIQVASWSINSKNIQQKEKIFSPKKGIITIDNKFLIIQQKNGHVEMEMDLREVKIDEGENAGQVILKSKKKRSEAPKTLIKFDRPENQDEFKLHMQRARGQIE